MKTIAVWWTWACAWLRRLWRQLKGHRGDAPLYTITRVDDLPERPARGVLYVAEEEGTAWAASMACPGGCGQVLHMNLLPDMAPVWRLTEHAEGAATLHPSVWRREGCGCHFWLRRGRIEWVAEDGFQVRRR